MVVADDPSWEVKNAKKVVRKYETGNSGSDEEESFERDSRKEPDQFGFLQSPSFLAAEAKYLRNLRKTTKRREKKWGKMFRDYEKSRKKKLPSRVFKGVPQSVRREFWNQTLKVDRFQQPYLTQELSYNLFYRNGQSDSAVVRQIDLDVARTWRSHSRFRPRYGRWQKYLFRILIAYSAFDVTVGYCQGSATTLVLFRLNQNKICRLDFDSLTTFLQSDICKISIDDDSFFSKIQKVSDQLLSQGQIAPVDYGAPAHRSRSLPRAQSPTPSGAVRKTKPLTLKATPNSNSSNMRHELVKEFVTVSSQSSTLINNNHSKPYPNIQKSAQPTTQRSVPKTRKIRVQEATTSKNEDNPKSDLNTPRKRIDVLPPKSDQIQIDQEKLDKLSGDVSDWVAKYSRHSRELMHERKQIYFMRSVYPSIEDDPVEIDLRNLTSSGVSAIV